MKEEINEVKRKGFGFVLDDFFFLMRNENKWVKRLVEEEK